MTQAEEVKRLQKLLENVHEEVEMSKKRLITMCNQVNAGERQGGGREFERQIDSQFRGIWKVLGKPR